VQWVNRPNLDFRGFSGLISTGSVKPGDAFACAAVGQDIDCHQNRDAGRRSGRSRRRTVGYSLCFADEIDCSRGNVIATADNPPEVSDQFETTIVWMDDDALHVGRSYWLKLGTQMVSATVQQPKYTST
jgi:bifunctional enzyme CysN/CysC